MTFLKTWGSIVLGCLFVAGIAGVAIGSVEVVGWSFATNHDWLGYIILFFWGTLLLTVLTGPPDH
jgi:hypothetical protein